MNLQYAANLPKPSWAIFVPQAEKCQSGDYDEKDQKGAAENEHRRLR